ncbi:MAG: DNA starvation/stationary phase protection protein [Vicinamibacteria bacterium]
MPKRATPRRAPAGKTKEIREFQPFGHLVRLPLALGRTVCRESVENLNQMLADTLTLRDLYQKSHWQASGPNFYQLHLLFEKHYNEQSRLADSIAERIQSLGGVSLAMSADIAETTLIPRPTRGREGPAAQLAQLLHAHEIVLREARAMARVAAEHDDYGTNDLLVSGVIRQNELQVWFIMSTAAGGPLPLLD